MIRCITNVLRKKVGTHRAWCVQTGTRTGSSSEMEDSSEMEEVEDYATDSGVEDD